MSASSYNQAIQIALRDSGFNPGPIDGVIGPQTRAAIQKFQTSVGLRADGIAGPETIAALNPFGVSDLTQYDNIPWFQESLRLLHIEEFSSGSNPAVHGRAGLLEINYAGDEVAWCGLHVGYCVRRALPKEPLPTNEEGAPEGLLGARRWLTFGSEVNPKVGAIMVFWRESVDDWRGHVGFYYGEQGDHYQILGGNQSDKVSVALYEKRRFLGARWPITA